MIAIQDLIKEYIPGNVFDITDEPNHKQAEFVTLADLDPNWHPKVKQAIDMARNWQKRRRQQIADGQIINASMVLIATGTADPNISGYGCGKTHIARAALWSIATFLDGRPIAPAGLFYTAPDLIMSINAEKPIKEMVQDAPIIVIDDVGTEGTIPFVATESQQNERHARYFRFIDYCYQKGVSLILTGNLTFDQLANHIGGRAFSRLLQMAPSGYVIDMTGVPDYRRKLSGR